MGNRLDRRTVNDSAPLKKLDVTDFAPICTIGEGNYAKVQLVQKKDTGDFFAMKILRKDALIDRGEVEHTLTERKILEHANHPFLVKMHYAFQTPCHLYIVMNFANGGELFSHLKQTKRFSESRARFYAAEICLALEYLHEGGAVYRDLKPENVLLGADGHIVLTDFGLSKILKDDHTQTFCGTPEYLAPEVLLGRGHGKAVDWWSLGTLLYEMIVGRPPFYSTDVQQMYEMILHSRLRIPEFVSDEATDLLARLLVRKPEKRLGSGPNGAATVKDHPFFKGVDWKALLEKNVEPPFMPTVKSPGDIGNVDPSFLDKPVCPIPTSQHPSNSSSGPNYFEGFTFSGRDRDGMLHRDYPDPALPDPFISGADEPPLPLVPPTVHVEMHGAGDCPSGSTGSGGDGDGTASYRTGPEDNTSVPSQGYSLPPGSPPPLGALASEVGEL